MFMNWVSNETRDSHWLDEWASLLFKCFMVDPKPTWLGFMERHGFIEEVREFVPYDIAIRINSNADANLLKLRMDYKGEDNQMWRQISDQIEAMEK